MINNDVPAIFFIDSAESLEFISRILFYITRCLFNDAVSSWEGLIVVVTRVDGAGFEFQTGMKFPFFQHVQTGCGAHRTSYSTGIGVSFLGIKRLELETGH